MAFLFWEGIERCRATLDGQPGRLSHMGSLEGELHLRLHAVRELFNLFGLPEGVNGDDPTLGFLQVFTQFCCQLLQLFHITPDLDLALSVGGNRLLLLNVVAGESGNLPTRMAATMRHAAGASMSRR